MAHCFFVVYYEPDASHFVDDACEQLARAIRRQASNRDHP